MKSSCLAKFPAALALLLACPAHAADILEARYDAASDQITAEIAYRGTDPDHDFSVQWGQCSDASPPRVVGRLIDAQGDDIAREDYRVEARNGLQEIPCRPAIPARCARPSRACFRSTASTCRPAACITK